MRSAVCYSFADPEQSRRAHEALAAGPPTTNTDPDRRVWHRARAVVEPNDDIADELHKSAVRARARGGIAAAAAFRARAAALTRDRSLRGQRALEAAELALSAGSNSEVSELLSICEAGPLDPLGRARVELIRARMAFAVNRAGGDPSALVTAAGMLETVDVPLARRTYLDALVAAIYPGRLGEESALREVARAALERAMPRVEGRAAEPPDYCCSTALRRCSSTGTRKGSRC